jgi:RNA polymerase sigma factor (sigma-70 family)
MRPVLDAPTRVACDLDLGQMEDEPLVVLAQECGYGPAWDELLCRCSAMRERIVGQFAARGGLQEADRQDAEQEAVLWEIEAIRRYHTDEMTKARPCRFRSFLYRVLVARLIDTHRRRCFLQDRLRLVGLNFVWLEGPRSAQHRRALPDSRPDGDGDDPERLLEQDELLARLRQELQRLSGPARGLSELLLGGMRLREIAVVLGMSYEAAKRLRRKLFARLRARLGPMNRP